MFTHSTSHLCWRCKTAKLRSLPLSSFIFSHLCYLPFCSLLAKAVISTPTGIYTFLIKYSLPFNDIYTHRAMCTPNKLGIFYTRNLQRLLIAKWEHFTWQLQLAQNTDCKLIHPSLLQHVHLITSGETTHLRMSKIINMVLKQTSVRKPNLLWKIFFPHYYKYCDAC